MPFCFWCAICKKKKAAPEDFEPMNEDLTEINENVAKIFQFSKRFLLLIVESIDIPRINESQP